MRYVLALAVLSVTPLLASAFELDGFRSGMSQQEVRSLAAQRGKLEGIDAETDVVQAEDGTYSSFNFCKGRLVAMQQGHPVTLNHLVLLTAEFNNLHGQPFSVTSGTKSHPSGQIHELGMWWRAGSEYVSVYYLGTPGGGGSMSTSRQVKNACFKVPR